MLKNKIDLTFWSNSYYKIQLVLRFTMYLGPIILKDYVSPWIPQNENCLLSCATWSVRMYFPLENFSDIESTAIFLLLKKIVYPVYTYNFSLIFNSVFTAMWV